MPAFSLPYTHYSLIARSAALRRYCVEGCCLEASAPPMKDPHRVVAPSSLRRWFRDLDSSRPAFSVLRPTVQAIEQWIRDGQFLSWGDGHLSWPIVYPLLYRYWPLRL